MGTYKFKQESDRQAKKQPQKDTKDVSIKVATTSIFAPIQPLNRWQFLALLQNGSLFTYGALLGWNKWGNQHCKWTALETVKNRAEITLRNTSRMVCFGLEQKTTVVFTYTQSNRSLGGNDPWPWPRCEGGLHVLGMQEALILHLRIFRIFTGSQDINIVATVKIHTAVATLVSLVSDLCLAVALFSSALFSAWWVYNVGMTRGVMNKQTCTHTPTHNMTQTIETMRDLVRGIEQTRNIYWN